MNGWERPVAAAAIVAAVALFAAGMAGQNYVDARDAAETALRTIAECLRPRPDLGPDSPSFELEVYGAHLEACPAQHRPCLPERGGSRPPGRGLRVGRGATVMPTREEEALWTRWLDERRATRARGDRIGRPGDVNALVRLGVLEQLGVVQRPANTDRPGRRKLAEVQK